jgi:hypothetical protein
MQLDLFGGAGRPLPDPKPAPAARMTTILTHHAEPWPHAGTGRKRVEATLPDGWGLEDDGYSGLVLLPPADWTGSAGPRFPYSVRFDGPESRDHAVARAEQVCRRIVQDPQYTALIQVDRHLSVGRDMLEGFLMAWRKSGWGKRLPRDARGFIRYLGFPGVLEQLPPDLVPPAESLANATNRLMALESGEKGGLNA